MYLVVVNSFLSSGLGRFMFVAFGFARKSLVFYAWGGWLLWVWGLVNGSGGLLAPGAFWVCGFGVWAVSWVWLDVVSGFAVCVVF